MVCCQLLSLFLFQDDAATTAPVSTGSSALLEMVHNSGPVAFAVLITLLLASIFSWTIMLSKWSSFRRAQAQSTRFIRAFRKSGRLSEIAAVADQFKPSPLVAVFTEINDEYQRQSGGRGMPRNRIALERAAQIASSEALTNMEQRMTWLATIAAVAPFIGLLGTVMGIIDAFHGLGTPVRQPSAPSPRASRKPSSPPPPVWSSPSPPSWATTSSPPVSASSAARMDDFGREFLNLIENAAMASTPPPARRRDVPAEVR